MTIFPPFSQPVTEIVRKRFSCRTYTEQPITGETRRQLEEALAACRAGPFGAAARFALLAATEDDRRALRGLGTYGFIKGATGFIVGAAREGVRNLEDYGYLMEWIVLRATDLGLGTCWLGGSFSRSSFERKLAVQPGETMPAVVSVGYIADEASTRDRLIRQGAGSARRLPWERLFFDGAFDRPLTQEAAGEYATPLEMVRLGPSASNKQPWRIVKDGNAWHFYLRRTAGYPPRSFGRLLKIADIQRLDMGIAMCHFELAARELGLPGRWELREPPTARPDDLTAYTATWAAG